MYTQKNFKTKKAFKTAVANGERVTLVSTSPFAQPKENGTEYVSGPHYPEPHRWYATVQTRDGVVVSVK